VMISELNNSDNTRRNACTKRPLSYPNIGYVPI
jgi:hypothetical protein